MALNSATELLLGFKMSTPMTLVEASKLGHDDLVAGVIESIYTTDSLYRFLPFQPVAGNAKSYVRELALGDAQSLAIGGAITATGAPTFTKVMTPLTTLIGDAYVNNQEMAQAIGQNGGNDLVVTSVMSKAKSIARLYANYLINGDVSTTATSFDGLAKLVPAEQTVAGVISFDKLDELLQKVKSKGTKVDALIMNGASVRAFRALERALGGTSANWTAIEGVNVPQYAGTPILQNDWILDGAVYAVNFDDGGGNGIAGLSGVNGFGINVSDPFPAQGSDDMIHRVSFYSSFAVYSNLGVAKLTGTV